MEIRTADISLVLDTILARSAGGADGVYALVDGARIGVMGHSLGGSAALAIPSQRDDVVAVIALEPPFFHDTIGVENGEFLWLDKAYPVPVLNIYSDSSWSHLSEWPQYARNAALLTDAPETAVSLHLPGAATLHRETWFFPAAMIVVGSHYLPFITLYGMKLFGVLAALLVVAGAGLALYGPPIFSLGGWLTGAVLIGFAFAGRHAVLREEAE